MIHTNKCKFNPKYFMYITEIRHGATDYYFEIRLKGGGNIEIRGDKLPLTNEYNNIVKQLNAYFKRNS